MDCRKRVSHKVGDRWSDHQDNKRCGGKFGRILGELWCFNTNVNEKMIEEHHAVRYTGQSKSMSQEYI